MTSAGQWNTTSSTRSVRSIHRASRRILLVSQLRAKRRRAVRRTVIIGMALVVTSSSRAPQFCKQRCCCCCDFNEIFSTLFCAASVGESRDDDSCHTVTDSEALTLQERTVVDIWWTVRSAACRHVPPVYREYA